MLVRVLTACLCMLALLSLGAQRAGAAGRESGISLNLQRELGAVARHHPSNQLAPPVSTAEADDAKLRANAELLPGATPAEGQRSTFGTRLGYAGTALIGSLLIGQGTSYAGTALGVLLALAASAWLLRRLLQGAPLPAPTLRTEPVGWGPAPPPQANPVPPLARATPDGGVLRLPPGFDLAAFLREARLSFARLRDAHDHADLTDLREFTTPEMYEVLAQHIHERLTQGRKAEVTGLDAQLVDLSVAHEDALATVRFHGSERGEAGSQIPFTEVWQVRKRLSDPRAFWLLDGIQPTP